MKKIFLSSILISLSVVSVGQSNNILGKWRTFDLYHNMSYYFDSTNTVLISQYGRELIGSYNYYNDTITINYRPFYTISQSIKTEDISDSLIIQIQGYYSYKNQNQLFPIEHSTITAYYSNSNKKSLETNDSGKVILPFKKNIDSIRCFISPLYSIIILGDSIRGDKLSIQANKIGVDISGFSSLPKMEKLVVNNEYKMERLNRISIEIEPAFLLFRLDKDSTFIKIENEVLNAKMIDYGTPYLLKHFIFNSWQIIDTFYSQKNLYIYIKNYPLPYLHSGTNRFCLETKKIGRVKLFEIESNLKEVYLIKKNIDKYIEFSDDTYYEIYSDEKLLLKGRDDKISCKDLANGVYYICFDNSTYKKIKIKHKEK